jgi:hypothetical protein
MSNRDNFSPNTKRAVALRANYLCSLCRQLTSGPSDESPTAVTNIGEAAHISGAASGPGSRRYVESMSPEERSHISNAIWMCKNHAGLVDRDDSTYTIASLRQMKLAHEAVIKKGIQLGSDLSLRAHDLIAIGPDVICTGELLGIDGSEWSLHLRNFVSGDFNALVAFVDKFPTSAIGDRYILVNELGDGRVLTTAPTLTKEEVGYMVRCQVAPSFSRIPAKQLGSQMAASPITNDLYLDEKGNIARVSGLESLPQSIRQCLSLRKGEFFGDRNYGTRLAEFFEAFRGSPWLDYLLKLEVIRQSAIPYHHGGAAMPPATPLRCVERVRSVEVLAEAVENDRLPIRCDLEINGVGSWQCEISIWLPLELTGTPLRDFSAGLDFRTRI